MKENKFCFENNDNNISFEDGIVSFSTHSYYIDLTGYYELSKEDTKKLYEAMKNYYERIEVHRRDCIIEYLEGLDDNELNSRLEEAEIDLEEERQALDKLKKP